MTALDAREVVLSYGDTVVLDRLSLRVTPARTTALVGANASGKSTLLRGLARLLRPRAGAVLLDGREIASMRTRDVARRMAILPQDPTVPEGLTVRQLVAQGRFPHHRPMRRWSPDDEHAVGRALAMTAMTELSHRPLDELSGGQRQHAWIAMALAQQTEVLLLDEPTTYLDIAHQVAVLELLSELNRREGSTIVMVLHDLNQAARYADEILALRHGRVVACGPPAEVVTEEIVREVFDVEVRIIEDPVTGGPMCVAAGGSRVRATVTT
jgi:iron complex transport system ATP-binding protein